MGDGGDGRRPWLSRRWTTAELWGYRSWWYAVLDPSINLQKHVNDSTHAVADIIANTKKSVASNIQTLTRHTLKMRRSVSSNIQTLTSDTLNTGERVSSNFQTMTRTTLHTRERVYPTFNPDNCYIKQFPISKLPFKYSNPLLFLWVSLKRVLAVGNTHLSFPAHVQLGWGCCRHHYSAWTPQCQQDETQQRRIHQLWQKQRIKSNKHR